APLQRVRFENRRGAGGVIDGRHHVARLMDRPGRREAQLGVVLGADAAGTLGLLPHLADHPAQIRAGRAQLRPALRDLRLDHVVGAQRALRPAGYLVAGDLDERLVGAARDPQGHVRKAHRVNHAAGELIERARLAPLGIVVARGGIGLADEMVLELVAVAAGAAQAEHLPVVDDRRLLFGNEHRAGNLPSVRAEAWAAVRLEDRAMRAEPGGVPAAGREAPLPGNAVAALGDDAFAGPRKLG